MCNGEWIYYTLQSSDRDTWPCDFNNWCSEIDESRLRSVNCLRDLWIASKMMSRIRYFGIVSWKSMNRVWDFRIASEMDESGRRLINDVVFEIDELRPRSVNCIRDRWITFEVSESCPRSVNCVQERWIVFEVGESCPRLMDRIWGRWIASEIGESHPRCEIESNAPLGHRTYNSYLDTSVWQQLMCKHWKNYRYQKGDFITSNVTVIWMWQTLRLWVNKPNDFQAWNLHCTNRRTLWLSLFHLFYPQLCAAPTCCQLKSKIGLKQAVLHLWPHKVHPNLKVAEESSSDDASSDVFVHEFCKLLSKTGGKHRIPEYGHGAIDTS